MERASPEELGGTLLSELLCILSLSGHCGERHCFLRQSSYLFLFLPLLHPFPLSFFLASLFLPRMKLIGKLELGGVCVWMVACREKGDLLMLEPTTRKETRCFYLNNLSPQLSLHMWKKNSNLFPFHTLQKTR